MKPKVTQSQVDFKKKPVVQQTPIKQMNKSQVSVTSQISQSRSQKSFSQGHSRLKSGNESLIEKMDKLPQDVVRLKQQISQLKIMELSQEARQSLMKLQRFDRYIFPMQSQRILKKPIQDELKRLEKIKNQQLDMRGRLYDNQLTITALYNHIKLINQMNRQLQQREVLRKQKDEAVRKMHEQKRESLKQVRQLKEQIRMGHKMVTPVKIQRQPTVEPHVSTPQVTPFKKQQATTLNFISATLRGKKYAEAIEEIRKFINKSGSSHPQACKLLQMFLPALEDQLTTMVQTKTVQTKYSQISILIEKTNKQIRVNHFEELEKMKIQALKANSQYKSLGLLLQSILNMKKMDEAEKRKKGPNQDNKSLEKVNQRVKTIEDELKSTKEQLFREKATNAQNLKSKQTLQKQLEKLKADFERAQNELQNYKKIEADQKKVSSKTKSPEDQLRIARQQLNSQRTLKISLQKQVQKLATQVETLKKSEAESKRSTSKVKQNDEELKSLRQQLKNERIAKGNLQRQITRLQNQLKPMKDQIASQTTIKSNLEKQIQRIQAEYEGLKKSEAEIKRGSVKMKQNEDQIKSLREQVNTQRSAKVNLERENQKLLVELKPLREQINNERSTKVELENQIQKIQIQLNTLKKSEAQIKRGSNKMKQNEDEIKNLREQLNTERSAKVSLERENQKLQIQLKPLRQQINNERSMKAQLQSEVQRIQSQYNTLRKSEAEIKRASNKMKQNEEQIQSLRQQLATQRTTKINLQREAKKLQTEVGPLRQQLSNQKSAHQELEKEFNRIQAQFSQTKKSDLEGKKSQAKLKQLQKDNINLREQLEEERSVKNNLERENRKLQSQVKPLRQQLNNEKASKQELFKELQNVSGSKKTENEIKMSLIRLKQAEDEVKSLRQQVANERANNYCLTQDIQKMQSEFDANKKFVLQSKKGLLKAEQNEQQLVLLKEQLGQLRASNNQLNKTNRTLQKQLQISRNQTEKYKRLESDLESSKKSQIELKKIVNKSKTTEEELRKVRQELNNQIQANNQGKRIRKNMQSMIQKIKGENQRLKAVEIQYEQLKTIEAEFKRNNEKLKLTSDQARGIREQLEHERANNYEISRDKQLLQRQIQKLSAQIEMFRKNEELLKTRQFEAIKKIQLQAKSKEQLLIQNLRQDILKAQSDLNYSLDSLEKIVKASSSGKPYDDLQKLKRQLTSSQHSASRKLLPLLEAFIRSNNRSIQLQGLVDKMTRQENERRRKTESQNKNLSNEISQFRQNGNLICQALKSAARIWTRTKSEQLYSDNKIIEILQTEIKKGNQNRHLENVESEIIAIVESLVNLILGQLSKIQDGYIKIIEQKNRDLEKALAKQQNLSQSESEKEKKIVELEEQLKNANNGVDHIKREGLTYVRQIQRLMKEHERVIYEANLTAEELNKQIQAGSKLNKEILQLKKDITRLTGEKQGIDIKLQEANQQIARLKKHTQEYVNQERKVLQTLQLEGKQKEKFQRQQQNLQRSLEKSEKQRQFYEKKAKLQDAQLLKLKQLEIILQNTIQENEIKSSTLHTTILSREKEVKNLNQRHKIMIEEKDKLQQQIIILQKQLGTAKFEIQKAIRQIRDTSELSQRQKHDLNREIERLNLHITFEKEERQSDKRHHASIVARLEKHLGNAEAHRTQQVRQIQTKMELMLKEKEDARRQLENQQGRYRQKLKEVSRDLELTSLTGEREKIQMKRQIDRLTQQLTTAIQTTQIQKNELRKSVERLQAQKQRIIQDRTQQKRVLQEEIERAKNEQYQQSYEKLRKQRQQIRMLQEEVDKLNQIIDINEGNYNKIVEDNRQMFEKITELQSSQKNYTQEVQMLKDKSQGDLNTVHLQASRNTQLTKHIEKLQTQVKEFQIVIATNNRQMTFANSLKDRVKELQARVDELQHENIKLKVHEDQNLKQLNKYREETIQLKTENAALDRELYAMKSRPDSSQSQTILFNKYEDMARKYEQVNQQSLKYKFDSSNFERMLKEKQFETIKALELKHLQMEKDLLDNSWKQRMDALNQRFKQQTKELEVIRAGLETKKDQYNTDIMNLKIEKDRLERSLSDCERKLAEIKEQNGKNVCQMSIREEQKRLNIEKYNSLLKNLEQKVKDLQRSQGEVRNLSQQNKSLSQQLILKQQANTRENQRITQILNNKIQGLLKQVQEKRKIIQQKQNQIRQFITKFTSQNNEKTAMYTQKQMEYQTSSMLYERTIQDLKKQNTRLNIQLETTTKKLEEKIGEASNLLMELKQSQSDKQLSDEQFKYKIETLTSKNNDLLREVDALKLQLRNSLQIMDNQKQNSRQQKQRLQKSLAQLSNRNRLLQDALQKSKIQKVTLLQREKSLHSQLQQHQQQLYMLKQKSSKIEGGTIKVKEQNKYLKQIVQMLDTNYIEDEEQDQNQIKILMKISQEISYLIERNLQLEKQVKVVGKRASGNDQEWLSSIQFLIQSLLEYLNQSELIGHKNVTKFVYSAEFKAESLYDQKEKYMVYVENFIKELFQNVVAELSENISLYERTFGDLRKFVESYFSSGDQRYLESLRKCLKKFEV